ncbi:helix-turn-helix domain-containing protein [Leptolyngbya sp. 7M]|uniref:helix-turn-helix domain-containing protein n=1 Tax=Leptolyngbya sp. 7M TaxID=2812896 RepID=UPI001B8A96F1|nr:helix-turn-helix domain-containing protein [Leptolyngbya sp. 7M]QYO62450.1 helix-turn-helix domain-containing protein [Leptolyngbya sp. 7M]
MSIPPESIQLILETLCEFLLNAEDAQIRAKAAESLGRLGLEDAIPILREAIVRSALMSEFDAQLTLVQLRQRVGLTQQDLADAIGVTQKTISIWEKGSVEPKLSLRQTKILMDVLNCTFDELVEATQP